MNSVYAKGCGESQYGSGLAAVGDILWLFPAQLSGFGAINGTLYYTISPRIRRWGRPFRVEAAIFTGIGAAVHLIVSSIVFAVEIEASLFVISPNHGQVTFSQFMELNSLSLGVPSIIAMFVWACIERSIFTRRERKEQKREREETAERKV